MAATNIVLTETDESRVKLFMSRTLWKHTLDELTALVFSQPERTDDNAVYELMGDIEHGTLVCDRPLFVTQDELATLSRANETYHIEQRDVWHSDRKKSFDHRRVSDFIASAQRRFDDDGLTY